MVTAEVLASRREEIAGSQDLQRLLEHLAGRAAPLIDRLPVIPAHKAMLSTDGGVCPDDRVALTFDPYRPDSHRCPRCGKSYTGDRHDRHWARFQHLWLAERAAHLAAIGVLADDARAGDRAREILAGYAARYLSYPNRDNVLGPSRLFFSTYLESIWLCNYLSAAVLLRESDLLDDEAAQGVSQVADEAANLIGDFDEGFSNRQTWNNAALTAIAVWFEDAELASRAIEGNTGLMAHLARGFGRDGLWYEGENYHLFALRGLLVGAGWARQAGVDILETAAAAGRLADALGAPAVTALPDCTYPARKDARFGVTLAQPAFIELWELGLAALHGREAGDGKRELWSWLRALYQAPAAVADLHESYLHDTPLSLLPSAASRTALSWRALIEMCPDLPTETPPWSPGTELLSSQGLAILRSGAPERYVSLECGPAGGHAHLDRLNLTLYADGAYWLPDIGTGSYVSRDHFWYRSTLAHNAPRLDGRSQPLGNAVCEAFDTSKDGWSWVRGRFEELSRTVVSGPAYVIDVVDLSSREEHLLENGWHLAATVETPGEWVPDTVADETVRAVQRFTPTKPGSITLTASDNGRGLRVHFASDAELLRLEGLPRPRKPGETGDAVAEQFFAVRTRGRGARLVTVLESAPGSIRAVRAKGDVIELDTANGTDRHSVTPTGWTIERGGSSTRLAGRRQVDPPFQPLLEIDPPVKVKGHALRIAEPPALDGTLTGFDCDEPLTLDVEDQYRRSEEPYAGADELSARACVNWTEEALYVAIEVTKPAPCFRRDEAPPLLLDNEPDDIHSDGVQLYFEEREQGDVLGFLIVPEEGGERGGGGGGGVRVHSVAGTAARTEQVRGRWRRTAQGYSLTLAITLTEHARVHVGGKLPFDLIVNEMRGDRQRRAGQLVWSGGNGWVWLRGDRQSPERFGVLELLG